MDLKQLKCFAAVAEELHFGHAAQRMNMLPSTLCRQVKLLEEDLGTRLLVRSTRHVSLTPAGIGLRQDARSILQQVEAAERSVRQLAKAKGTALRIGAIDSAAAGLLPALLGEFRGSHPDIETQLVECTSAQQLQFLLSGRLDLAFVRPPVRESGLKYEFLLYETLVVAMPVDHPLSTKDQVDIHDLARVPLVVPPRQVRPHSHKLIMRAFEAAGETAEIVFEASEKQTIISLVAAGIGVAIVPTWVAKMQLMGVTYRPLHLDYSMECSESAVGIAWSEDLRSAPRELFIKLVRTSFARAANTQAGHAARVRTVGRA